MAKFNTGEGGSSGGHEAAGMMRWLLTYADVITLLLIVFVMMFAFSQLDLKKFEQVKDSFNSVFSSDGNVRVGIFQGVSKDIKPDPVKVLRIKKLARLYKVPVSDVRQAVNLKNTLQKEFQSTNTQNISLDLNERGLIVSFSGQVLFDLGKSDIRSSMVPALSKVGKVVKDINNPVRIEGFTDNIPIKTSKYPSNWELSTARATAVLRFLVENLKINPKRLSAAGYGEYKPNYPNINEKNRSLNRKVDIVIMYMSLSREEPKQKF